MLFWTHNLYKDEGDYSDDKPYYLLIKRRFKIFFINQKMSEFKYYLTANDVMEYEYNKKKYIKNIIKNYVKNTKQ